MLMLLEHLSELLEGEEKPAGQFRRSFLHARTALSLKPTARRAATHSKSTAVPSLSLRPTYSCLQCSTVCSPGGRQSHRESTNHVFCKTAPQCASG